MSRQDVLALLREQEGAFVSGEEISHRLGLRRAEQLGDNQRCELLQHRGAE